MNRIVDPPREVPLGLQLKLFEAGAITRSWICFLPAAIFLSTGAFRSDGATEYRVGITLFGLVLVTLGYMMALPALFTSLRTLRRMRNGLMTTGRIVSCHFEWDRKRQEIPYRQLLEDWGMKAVQSQGDQVSGCLAKAFLIVFGAPLFLMAAVLGIVLATNHSMLAAGGAIGGLTADDLWFFIRKWLLFVVAMVGMLYLLGAITQEKTGQDAEQHRTPAGSSAAADASTAELVAQAREQAQGIELKEPLPKGEGSVELVCRVEYSAMGERRTATGRARLCDRLDLAGVEQLLYDPLDHRAMVLFVGLPEEVRSDELGQWHDVPAGAAGLKLALNVAIALGATTLLLQNAFILYARFSLDHP